MTKIYAVYSIAPNIPIARLEKIDNAELVFNTVEDAATCVANLWHDWASEDERAYFIQECRYLFNLAGAYICSTEDYANRMRQLYTNNVVVVCDGRIVDLRHMPLPTKAAPAPLDI